MEFEKEVLQELAWRSSGETLNDEGKQYTVKVNKIVGNTRWATEHELVFEADGRFYETSYRRGATEYQDEAPFEYEGDMIECREVIPVEVVAIEYVSATGATNS